MPEADYIICGGFPCQPHSQAGKRKGDKDDRDLWPECVRMLRELRPRIAVFENVRGLLTSPGKEKKGEFFNRVLSDIHESGYITEWQVISAADVGANHKRERVWIICWNSNGSNATAQSKCETLADTYCKNDKRRLPCGEKEKEKESQSCECGQNIPDTSNNGILRRDRLGTDDRKTETTKSHNGRRTKVNESWKWWEFEPDVGRVANGIPSRVDRLKCLGNAIVPQCAELIFNLPAFDKWRLAQ